jgi:hypothetical protein
MTNHEKELELLLARMQEIKNKRMNLKLHQIRLLDIGLVLFRQLLIKMDFHQMKNLANGASPLAIEKLMTLGRK